MYGRYGRKFGEEKGPAGGRAARFRGRGRDGTLFAYIKVEHTKTELYIFHILLHSLPRDRRLPGGLSFLTAPGKQNFSAGMQNKQISGTYLA